jgi:hypothetical protein
VNVFNLVKTHPDAVGQPPGADPYIFVAEGFWQSPEHRRIQVQSYYHDFLGRDIDPNDAHNVSEREYWVNQFLLAGAQETDVIRGFFISPEYLYKHRSGAGLADALNDNLLLDMASSTHLNDWSGRLANLDASRAAVRDQVFVMPEDYKATLTANLPAYTDETRTSGVLADAVASNEYRRQVLTRFYLAFVQRPGTDAEITGFLALQDTSGKVLSLGTMAEMMLGSPEYRKNALQSEV